ncbi:hypothetical protein H257_18136 [Aphanomyces astaci]|uniref:Uncharacterized protein n=1 Tax=Aphanomyces astaci TaxID=112090 RepID=W4FEB6_APHAT|nr:hypothetical protein H257_18136 [Aphanomyces astaci]ETV65048.1 hypothetical protein H257_18136 [Aphanomyces astaci]|eukprot:XP_009845447.1 hypothetical protein H257_18136 [Aphanomyces astaci]
MAFHGHMDHLDDTPCEAYGCYKHAKRPALGGQGAKGHDPFQTYLKAWMDTYVDGNVDPYKSLLRLCQSFATRHRFSKLIPYYTKLPELDMALILNDFAATF